jgi:hypothetical protein
VRPRDDNEMDPATSAQHHEPRDNNLGWQGLPTFVCRPLSRYSGPHAAGPPDATGPGAR